MGLVLHLEREKKPIGRVATKVVAAVAGEGIAESPVSVAARPVTSPLIVGLHLEIKVARASPLFPMLRKCRWIRKIRWSPKIRHRNMGAPMLVSATWLTLACMWVLVVCKVCFPSVSRRGFWILGVRILWLVMGGLLTGMGQLLNS